MHATPKNCSSIFKRAEHVVQSKQLGSSLCHAQTAMRDILGPVSGMSSLPFCGYLPRRERHIRAQLWTPCLAFLVVYYSWSRLDLWFVILLLAFHLPKRKNETRYDRMMKILQRKIEVGHLISGVCLPLIKFDFYHMA